jgi:hypothetical protein
MDDLFSNLARQALGSQPELGPLLPPRFAAWPDLSLARPLAQPAEPVDEPASADMPLFPPPLIDPGHPASDMPLPTFRQLSQVGFGPGPSIQPDVPPGPQDMLETADAGQNDMREAVGMPAGVAADDSLPGAHPATPQPAAIGQATEPLSAPPATGHGRPASGEAERAAATPLKPLGYELALELPATPGPTPIAQRQGAAAATRAAPPSPAPMPPPAQPVAGQGRTGVPPVSDSDQSTALEGPLVGIGLSPDHDRPKISRRADAAQGDQSPSISPLQPASPYQPGDLVPLGYLSPGQAGQTEGPPLSAEGRPGAPRDQENQRADTPLRPLVQSAPPGPDPVIQRQGTPAVTPNTTPAPEAKAPSPSPVASSVATTPGVHPSPGEPALPPALAFRETTIEPLDQLSTAPAAGPEITSGALTFPDQSRPGDAQLKPTVDRQAGESGRPGEGPIRPSAKQLGPVAGRGTPLAAEAAPEVTIAPLEPAAPAGGHPPPHRLREAPVDATAFSTPSEPGISPSTAGRSTPRTGERAFSRRMPARPENGQAEPLPTVRVTIGRIEVRTAPPPPPPLAPRPRPARTALSLDDYLKAGPGGEP